MAVSAEERHGGATVDMQPATHRDRWSAWASPATLVSLAIVAIALCGAYVRKGGFLYDDYADAAQVHFLGFWPDVKAFFLLDTRRPLQAVYLAVNYGVLGTHQHWHLLLSVLLDLAVSWVIFGILRELDCNRILAGGVALFWIVCPLADSIWLWAVGSQLEVCILFWLLGLLTALRGIGSRKHVWLRHSCAVLLYVCSLLMYEDALPVVLLSGLTYFAVVRPRRALRLWAADLAGLMCAVILFTSRLIGWGGGDNHQEGSILSHAGIIASQGLTVTADSLIPFGSPNRWLILALSLIVGAIAVVVATQTRRAALRRALLRDLTLACSGVAIAVAGWIMFAPAVVYYSPGELGVGNRVNAIAVLGVILLAAALVSLCARLTMAFITVRGRASGVTVSLLTACLLLVVGAGYFRHTRDDRIAWQSVVPERLAILQSIRRDVSTPPPGSTVIATGFTEWPVLGVPSFGASWDLNGAVQLMYDDDTLKAWPEAAGGLLCEPSGVAVASMGPAVPYDTAVFINVATNKTFPVHSMAGCKSLSADGF